MSLGNIAVVPAQPHIQNQQTRADGDGAVRDVECGKPVLTLIQLDEIRDLTEQYTIIDVAKRTPEYQRKADHSCTRRAETCPPRPQECVTDKDQNCNRNTDQKY